MHYGYAHRCENREFERWMPGGQGAGEWGERGGGQSRKKTTQTRFGGEIRIRAAVGETVILLHPALPLVDVSSGMERERQQKRQPRRWLDQGLRAGTPLPQAHRPNSTLKVPAVRGRHRQHHGQCLSQTGGFDTHTRERQCFESKKAAGTHKSVS